MTERTCDCGKPAPYPCSTSSGLPADLVWCPKWVCGEAGCAEHRHAAGSMGYGIVNASVTAEHRGFVPEGKGWRYAADVLRCFFRNHFLTDRAKALIVWREDFSRNFFPPPAPLPHFTLVVRGRSYTIAPDGTLELSQVSK